MVFEPIDFAQFNEMDVREEILAPLLRQLGYQAGTRNNIIREQSLRYPKAFIGRKNPQKDPGLRGKADYICEVDRKIRWTIEAKSPASKITKDEIEQAYTYANHPEVRAVYFCICNGLEFQIYQTNRAPGTEPLINVSYDKLNDSFDVIKNVLSPASILRDHPSQVIDLGRPIGLGLRSVVRITGGHIHIINTSLNLPPFKGLIYTIIGGAVERNENDQLVAFIKSQSPFAALQRLNERLGLSQSEYISNDTAVSGDPAKPTIFSSTNQIHLPAGEKILDLLSWREVILPLNLTCIAETLAKGILVGQDFKGEFLAKLRYLEVKLIVEMIGTFEVHLA
jgi:hypothetical protein